MGGMGSTLMPFPVKKGASFPVRNEPGRRLLARTKQRCFGVAEPSVWVPGPRVGELAGPVPLHVGQASAA